MERRTRRGAIIGFIAAIALGAVFAGMGGAETTSSAPISSQGSCADFAKIDVSAMEVNSTYDPELNVVVLTAGGKEYVINTLDIPCRASSVIVDRIVRDVERTYSEDLDGECPAWRGFLASGSTTFRGHNVDRGALQLYLNKDCVGH
jgi:hypothetical protein